MRYSLVPRLAVNRGKLAVVDAPMGVLQLSIYLPKTGAGFPNNSGLSKLRWVGNCYRREFLPHWQLHFALDDPALIRLFWRSVAS
jgi:hypothetical protein